jgi:hypothetical protein
MVHRFHIGRFGDVLGQVQPLLHGFHQTNLRRVNERDHPTAGSRSCGAPGTMHIRRIFVRRIEMNDTFHCVNMDASGRDVGSDKSQRPASRKVGECTFTLRL